MPRAGKVKIQWIMEKGVRQASFRKRRGTLFDKARDLSILCQIPAAVIVYGGGEAEPQVWPGVQEVTEILRRYRDLPDSLKEARRLDNEGFVRRRTQKMKRKLDNCRASASRLEVNLILNDISLGRPREFADLPRELTGAVVSALDALRSVTADRVNFLRSEAAQAAALPQQLLEEAVAAALMALQEPPMVPPAVAMAPPMVANAPLLLPALEPEPPMVPPLAMAPVVADAPLLMPVPEPEPPMVPPLAMAPVLADASLLLPAPEPEQPMVPPLAMAPVLADVPLDLLLLLLLLPEPEPEPVPPQSELVVALAPPPQEPPMVADAPLLLPAPEPEPPMMLLDLLLLPEPEPELVPPQSDELVVAPAPEPQEPPMVADASLLLPAAGPEPPATAAGAVVDEPLNLYAEPRDGSFLLEMADAIMDDGSGRQATAEDVDRLLREYGLESFKPM
ncbi:hypothetical protein PAHAL_3G111400 [Panicum hallii]|jgi:hypothetical protein|uniref:MADS-box domain-containing protein n=1 Tax=Panicum hallii TaxID=206008 RepID=A0A2S3H7Z7_9POAL|nr:hypothetical protein PAHAL_3G111400 [Panicum hallii]